MIAVFLIIMCAVPALNIYVNMYRSQSTANIINQRDHLARLTHARIIEDLYRRQPITFENIIEGASGEIDYPEIKSELDKIGYDAFYKFHVFSHKTDLGMRDAPSILTDLIITMRRKKSHEIEDIEKNETIYDYVVYIEREKSKDNPDVGKKTTPDAPELETPKNPGKQPTTGASPQGTPKKPGSSSGSGSSYYSGSNSDESDEFYSDSEDSDESSDSDGDED